jgi:hypothetical protein
MKSMRRQLRFLYAATLICGLLSGCGRESGAGEPFSKMTAAQLERKHRDKCQQTRQEIDKLSADNRKLEADRLEKTVPPRTVIQLFKRLAGPAGDGTDAADAIGENRRIIQLLNVKLSSEGC